MSMGGGVTSYTNVIMMKNIGAESGNNEGD